MLAYYEHLKFTDVKSFTTMGPENYFQHLKDQGIDSKNWCQSYKTSYGRNL
jgi:hypothetical protein